MHAPPRVRAALASRYRFISSLSALGLLLIAAPAAAQGDAPPPKPVEPPAANPAPAGADAKVPSLSLSLERVGGIGYAKASSSESGSDASVSLVAFGVGGVTPNPFAIPRLGLDFILPSQITLGGAIGFTRLSASTSEKSKPTSARSERFLKSSSRVASRVSASARVGGLKASKVRRKRTSRFSTPIQTESAPVLGLEAALQSTIT